MKVFRKDFEFKFESRQRISLLPIKHFWRLQMGKLYCGSSGGDPGKGHDNISCIQVKQAATVFTFVIFFQLNQSAPPATCMNDNSMSAGNHKTTFLEKHHRLDINQHYPTENQKVSLTSLNSPWTVLWLWYLQNKGVVSVVRYSKLGFYKLGLSGCYCHIINSRSPLHLGLLTPHSLEREYIFRLHLRGPHIENKDKCTNHDQSCSHTMLT